MASSTTINMHFNSQSKSNVTKNRALKMRKFPGFQIENRPRNKHYRISPERSSMCIIWKLNPFSLKNVIPFICDFSLISRRFFCKRFPSRLPVKYKHNSASDFLQCPYRHYDRYVQHSLLHCFRLAVVLLGTLGLLASYSSPPAAYPTISHLTRQI